MILDYNQNWIPIVSTHNYILVNLLRVMTHEIGHIIGLTHSRDRFSIMHPNYWSWLDTVD
jgi:predicted Zn-dependent protease